MATGTHYGTDLAYADIDEAIGNSLSLATVLPDVPAAASRPLTGVLTVKGEHDWPKIALATGQAYSFTASGLSSVGFVQVGTAAALDEGVSTIGSPTYSGLATATNTAFFRPDTTGFYYVDVSDAGGLSSYTVTATAVSTTFTNNTATTGTVSTGQVVRTRGPCSRSSRAGCRYPA